MNEQIEERLETEEQVPERQPEISINDFRAMKEQRLREFEKENRSRILQASFELRESFDKKWLKETGRNYFQPITEIPVTTGKSIRIDPKSNNYEGYWEVVFSPKGRPDDPNDVSLAVNGYCLQMKRSEPVIVPGPFLECCDNGVYAVYIQLPDQPRKIASYIKHFPYTVLRTATEEEYRAKKRMGDAMTREVREKEERIA